MPMPSAVMTRQRALLRHTDYSLKVLR